jgi:hypothetical protein
MIPSTPAYPLQRAVPGMVTAATFVALQVAARNPTLGPAQYPGAFSISNFVEKDVGNVDAIGNGIVFQIISSAANNATLNLRLTGWRPYGADQWIAETLCEVAATLSLAVGLAGHDLLDTERFADIITLVSGPDAIQIKSFTDDRPGSVFVDALGCPVLQIQAQTQNANILWSPM